MNQSAHPEIFINLLPRRAPAGMSSFLNKGIKVAQFSLVSLEILLLLALFFYAKMVFDFNTGYQRISDHLTELKSSQTLEGEVNDIASRLKYLENLRKKPNPNIQVVSNISQTIPPEISLTEVNVSSDKVTISGNMVDIFSLKTLVSALRRREDLKNFYFTQITVPSSRSPLYTFAVILELK